MRRLPRELLLPLLAFALLGGLAWGVARHGRSTPRGSLYLAVRAYADAVRDGDAGRAGRAAAALEPEALAVHVEALGGLFGHVEELELAPDGRAGRAEVVWLDARGRPRHVELHAWGRRPPSAWRLERIQVLR